MVCLRLAGRRREIDDRLRRHVRDQPVQHARCEGIARADAINDTGESVRTAAPGLHARTQRADQLLYIGPLYGALGTREPLQLRKRFERGQRGQSPPLVGRRFGLEPEHQCDIAIVTKDQLSLLA